MENNAPKTCDTEVCPACNDPTDMNWRRAMAVLENRYIDNGCKLGNYSYKLETLKQIVAEAGQ